MSYKKGQQFKYANKFSLDSCLAPTQLVSTTDLYTFKWLALTNKRNTPLLIWLEVVKYEKCEFLEKSAKLYTSTYTYLYS